MANYATLKAAIAAAIRENGNNEITGNLLQQQLLAMVNSLGVGYQYAGIATPATNPGTPDQNVFYIASTAGTYTNFGGLVLADGEIAILKYNGAWSKDSTGAASLEIVNQLGQYVENPEWVRVVTDADGRVLYGVKTDGEFYFGAGCPPQVKDYILSHLVTLEAQINNKVDKESGKSLINTDIANSLDYIDNPEFIDVKTDSEKKIIESTGKDGTKHLYAGLVVDKELELDRVLIRGYKYNDFVSIDVDENGKIISGRLVDGTKVEFCKVIFQDIQNNGGLDILSLFPRKKMFPVLKNYKFANRQTGSYIQTFEPLTFIHFSDIHENKINLQRISDFYNEYKELIDDVVFTGDAVDNVFNAALFDSLWRYSGGKKFLFITGNHDACSALSPFMPISPKVEYDTFIAPFLNDTQVNAVENRCYWYKDYPKSKSPECPGGIRLIALDQYHWREQDVIGDYVPSVYPDGTPVDTGQQEIWLENLLNDALQNGLAIITALHSPLTNTKCTDIDCTFNALSRTATAPYSEIPIGMLQKVQAFIDAGGEFICWMAGHMHEDWFVKITDYPEQVIMLINTASDSMTYRSDYLVPNSCYMDRFNIFNIHPVDKFIRLYRVGLNFDIHGRHMERLVYDYKNHIVVYNS